MIIGREPLTVSLKCDDHILNNSSISDLSTVSLVYHLMREVCVCQNPLHARLKGMSPLITIRFIARNKHFFTPQRERSALLQVCCASLARAVDSLSLFQTGF